jgi:hypothetical protein
MIALLLSTAACKGKSSELEFDADGGTTSRTRTPNGASADDGDGDDGDSATAGKDGAPPGVVGRTVITTKGGDAAPSTSTTRAGPSQGAYVSDPPRRYVPERTDNTGRLVFSDSPTTASAISPRAANDALEFTVHCVITADGNGDCHFTLVNHVKRTARFPGDLSIDLTFAPTDRARTTYTFPIDLPETSSMRSGERLELDASFDLDPAEARGTYDYFAYVDVSWP